jgi:hypothetical protein
MMPKDRVDKEVSEEGKAHKSRRRKVRRQEQDAADTVRGWTTSASGANPQDKGDAGTVRTGFAGECLLVECKHSFVRNSNGDYHKRFHLRWLDNVCEQATKKHSAGCVAIRLGEMGEDCWIFKEDDLHALCPDMFDDWAEDVEVFEASGKSFVIDESMVKYKDGLRICFPECMVVVVRERFVEAVVERVFERAKS